MFQMRLCVTLLLTAVYLPTSLPAPPRKTDARKTIRRTPVRYELKVTPSESIEARIQAEICKADAILDHMNGESIFDSPYVISALYYRDGFLSGYPSDRADGDPVRRIISHISRRLTPALKSDIIAVLRKESLPASHGPAFVLPVPAKLSTRPPRSRRTHQNAMDLFVAEGTPVRSASGGVVLLAESGWTESDPFSTSSHAGGNTVIVFDPEADRFYRYCHLGSVMVVPGAVVEAGQAIGTVGHSGLNASRPRHGGHLHFEINRWGGEMRPFNTREIWEQLRATR